MSGSMQQSGEKALQTFTAVTGSHKRDRESFAGDEERAAKKTRRENEAIVAEISESVWKRVEASFHNTLDNQNKLEAMIRAVQAKLEHLPENVITGNLNAVRSVAELKTVISAINPANELAAIRAEIFQINPGSDIEAVRQEIKGLRDDDMKKLRTNVYDVLDDVADAKKDMIKRIDRVEEKVDNIEGKLNYLIELVGGVAGVAGGSTTAGGSPE